MSTSEPMVHDGHLMGAAAVGAGHVTMMHLPDHDRPESCGKSRLGWRTQPEGRSTYGRATYPTPRAPEYLRLRGCPCTGGRWKCLSSIRRERDHARRGHARGLMVIMELSLATVNGLVLTVILSLLLRLLLINVRSRTHLHHPQSPALITAAQLASHRGRAPAAVYGEVLGHYPA
ncbi:hypothetical protein PIB30_080794 [Stylosanthes scabra]|uniref:Uncharacterized protein n=1 Tax=Stylosanthes scabra TaxID=79078 RepID=A0ABU6QR41_9FABA|nr:hypothetical protein [Stylosanthes scabra]